MIQEANLHWRYIDTDTNLIMPWYALPALQWLKQQDISNWIIFEYGAGYSTIWWRLNCLRVWSVDHIDEWAKAVGADFMSNKENYINAPEFYTKPLGAHCNPDFIADPDPDDKRKFDCIVIDGEFRDECVRVASVHVRRGGYMIVDNYGQEGFPDWLVIDNILDGWEKQVFRQPNHTDWATAIFKKP